MALRRKNDSTPVGEPATTRASTTTPSASTTTPATIVNVATTLTPPPSQNLESAADLVVDVPYDLTCLGANDDSIWVTNGRSLERHSIEDGQPRGTINGVQPAARYAVTHPVSGFGSIWTVDDDKVFRIDPSSMTVEATISIPDGTSTVNTLRQRAQGDIAVGPTGIWAISNDKQVSALVIGDSRGGG